MTRFRRLLTSPLVALWLCLLTACTLTVPAARADVLFTYAGRPFTDFAGSSFSSADSVSGMFTLATLPDIGVLETVQPTDYLFTDGVDTFTEANSLLVTFQILMNGSGAIGQWNIDILSDTCQVDCGEITTGEVRKTKGRSSSTVAQDSGTSSSGDTGQNNGLAGAWTEATVTDAPEPKNFVPLFLAMAALVFAVRRRFS